MIPEGFSLFLTREYVGLMKRYNCTSAYLYSTHERISDIVHTWECECINHMEIHQLDRKLANHETMENWLKDFPGKNPGLRVSCLDPIQEEFIPKLAELWHQFQVDVPTEKKTETKVLSLCTQTEMRENFD